MALTHLNNKQLYQAILGGCSALILQKEELNQINVFPIADADTGDNMASTANAIIKFSAVGSTLKSTMNSIADASILGARGNSGNIFSQFFNAWAEAISNEESLTIQAFSQQLLHASDQVRAALPNPVDGTLLTIIEAWAIYTKGQIDNAFFDVALAQLLPLLEQEVKKTASSIAILKKMNLVDAGALGFYYFVSGFSHALQNPESVMIIDGNPLALKFEHSDIPSCEPPDYRYCTEAVLKATRIDKTKLMSLFATYGDSSIVTSNERLCRFHVHTNQPQPLFAALMDDYTVLYPKIDDMHRQFQIHHDRRYSTALLTDSSADLPQRLLDQYQIHQISLNLQLNEHQLLDRYCLEANHFYHHLKQVTSYPKTACPAPGLIREKIELLAQHYDQVIIISLSKVMSGMYENFEIAAKNLDNVTVIDTKTNSAAQGLILHYAGKLIMSGMNLDTIVHSIKKAIETTYIFVIVDQFDSMIRSGRVNKLKGRMAEFLNIKPIISVNSEGRGFVAAKSFSVEAAFQKIIEIIKNKAHRQNLKLQDYAIVHAGAEEKAIKFADFATTQFSKVPEYIESVSLAIGLHAGQGCVALAVRMSHNDTD